MRLGALALCLLFFHLSADAKPSVVFFDLAIPDEVEDARLTPQVREVALTALLRGVQHETNWRTLGMIDRETLLDPAWTRAPSSLEEAIELGRELGVDWAVQAKLDLVTSAFRVTLKLIALSPEHRAANNRKSAQPLATTQEGEGRAPLIVDFNRLNAPQLTLAEHIVWAIDLPSLTSQLEEAGPRLLNKGQLRFEQNEATSRSDALSGEGGEESAEEEESVKVLSEKEKRAIELSDAARRELDDIQARLDAEHARREEDSRIKREVMAQEAEEAWAYLEQISGGGGLVTITVKPAPPLRRSRGRQSIKRDPIIQPAPLTWRQLQRATSNQLGISRREHLQLLLDFINRYQELVSYRPHVEEARNRYTWLNRSEIQWVDIRGGHFQLGSSFPIQDERPIQWISIPSFRISISEVTNAQYKRCVDEKACTPPHWDDGQCEIFQDLKLKKGSLPAMMRRGDMPVVCVTWQQAQRFASWAQGRLLSETEWEFTARSGQKHYMYPWGRDDASCDRTVMIHGQKSGCGFGVPWPVCSKPEGSNNAGVCDLAGNVWEWVADQYKPSHIAVPVDGSPRKGGGLKVIKGGAFSSSIEELYASTRGQLEPQKCSNELGIRVAQSREDQE